MTQTKRLLLSISVAALLIPQILAPRASAHAPGSITVGGRDIPIAAHGYVGHSMDDDAQLYKAQSIIDP